MDFKKLCMPGMRCFGVNEHQIGLCNFNALTVLYYNNINLIYARYRRIMRRVVRMIEAAFSSMSNVKVKFPCRKRVNFHLTCRWYRPSVAYCVLFINIYPCLQ
jgi:hypothetical protein